MLFAGPAAVGYGISDRKAIVHISIGLSASVVITVRSGGGQIGGGGGGRGDGGGGGGGGGGGRGGGGGVEGGSTGGMDGGDVWLKHNVSLPGPLPRARMSSSSRLTETVLRM